MGWSALFDQTHIVKGVPVDAEIELQCSVCGTHFRTANAYHVGYSPVHYANPAEEGRCTHSIKNLKPTNNWFPTREIHKQAIDDSWVSLFDYSHILENGTLENHSVAILRLLDELNLEPRELFRKDNEIIDEAYSLRGEQIAYKKTESAANMILREK